jgi:hypothetical protein
LRCFSPTPYVARALDLDHRLSATIMGVWLLMGTVAGATWIVNRWNRWWVWGIVSMVFVILAAVALEFITIVEEF